jgi:hypothetical protein
MAERAKGRGAVDAEVSRIVGVILERRPAKSRWADHVWRVVEVLDGQAAVEPFSQLAVLADGTVRYFAGNIPLTLHRTETEAYRTNLAGDRVLYAVLRPDETGTHPFSLHTVTASPQAASEFLESSEELVEAVPMPASIVAWVESFCAAHHKEEPFSKRQRNSVDIEQVKFSKEPIFARKGKLAAVEPGKPDD